MLVLVYCGVDEFIGKVYVVYFFCELYGKIFFKGMVWGILCIFGFFIFKMFFFD